MQTDASNERHAAAKRMKYTVDDLAPAEREWHVARTWQDIQAG